MSDARPVEVLSIDFDKEIAGIRLGNGVRLGVNLWQIEGYPRKYDGLEWNDYRDRIVLSSFYRPYVLTGTVDNIEQKYQTYADAWNAQHEGEGDGIIYRHDTDGNLLLHRLREDWRKRVPGSVFYKHFWRDALLIDWTGDYSMRAIRHAQKVMRRFIDIFEQEA